MDRSTAKMPMSVLLCAALLLVAVCAIAPDSRPPIKIVDRLMLQQSSTRPPSVVVDHIVLHFSSDVIAHPDHPYDIDRQIEIFRQAHASANYIIDRNGTVYRLVPEDRTAWHAGN